MRENEMLDGETAIPREEYDAAGFELLGAGADLGGCRGADAHAAQMQPLAGVNGHRVDAQRSLALAQELWWLAGNAQRAGAIAEVVERASVQVGPERRLARVLDRYEIRTLLALIEDLDEALKQTIVDDELNIRPERMVEVRRRAELIDVGERRGELASAAVWEALARVWALRNLLEEARERGLDVAIDV